MGIRKHYRVGNFKLLKTMTINDILDKKITELLSEKAYNFYVENSKYDEREMSDIEKAKTDYATMYDLNNMSLKDKRLLYNELISVNTVNSDIKTIKNWINFWSILSIVVAVISIIILINH